MGQTTSSPSQPVELTAAVWHEIAHLLPLQIVQELIPISPHWIARGQTVSPLAQQIAALTSWKDMFLGVQEGATGEMLLLRNNFWVDRYGMVTIMSSGRSVAEVKDCREIVRGSNGTFYIDQDYNLHHLSQDEDKMVFLGIRQLFLNTTTTLIITIDDELFNCTGHNLTRPLSVLHSTSSYKTVKVSRIEETYDRGNGKIYRWYLNGKNECSCVLKSEGHTVDSVTVYRNINLLFKLDEWHVLHQEGSVYRVLSLLNGRERRDFDHLILRVLMVAGKPFFLHEKRFYTWKQYLNFLREQRLIRR